MWMFGYGSLMWDSWETSHGCLQRQVAELHDYRRSFTKASVKNWGNPANPGPTLNLEEAERAICTGVAFEFSDAQADEVRSYLARREGKGFTLRPLQIRLMKGQVVNALVPIYGGPNVIKITSLADLARQISSARGTSGSCRDYIRGVHAELENLGIVDPAVAEIWGAVQILDQPDAKVKR